MPSFSEDLHQAFCEITISQLQTKLGKRQRATIVDRNSVRQAVSRVHHEDCRASRSKQRQKSLDRRVQGGHVERLEHELRHAHTGGFGVQQNFREQEREVPRVATLSKL